MRGAGNSARSVCDAALRRRPCSSLVAIGFFVAASATQAFAQLQIQGLTVGGPANRGLYEPKPGSAPSPAPTLRDSCRRQADDLQLQGKERADFEATCGKQ